MNRAASKAIIVMFMKTNSQDTSNALESIAPTAISTHKKNPMRQRITSRDRRWYYSYENICDTLEIDADYLREGISRCRRVETPRVAVEAVG